MRIFVVAVFVLVFSLGFFGQNSALVMAQGQGCFPGLGAVIDQFRCKKNEIIKGFPQGSGNGGGQPVVPRSTPTPSNAPRPVLRPLPQSVLPQGGQQGGQRGGQQGSQPRVDAPVEQPRQQEPSQRRFMVYNNVDLYGGDYARSKKGKWFSKEKCVEVCRRESTCIAFTYNVKHGVCFLKDELPEYRKSFKGAISGVLTNLRQPPRQSRNAGGIGGGDRGYDEPREVQPVNQTAGLCGSGYKTYDRIDFRGKDLAGYKVSFNTCRRTCNSSRDCSGFSWIKTAAKKRCWLKYETRDWRRKSNVLSCVKQ